MTREDVIISRPNDGEVFAHVGEMNITAAPKVCPGYEVVRTFPFARNVYAEWQKSFAERGKVARGRGRGGEEIGRLIPRLGESTRCICNACISINVRRESEFL